jgi:hypothetical protein
VPALTSTFSNSGKLTPYVVKQNAWISSAVPGSWSANWFHGNPTTENPLLA